MCLCYLQNDSVNATPHPLSFTSLYFARHCRGFITPLLLPAHYVQVCAMRILLLNPASDGSAQPEGCAWANHESVVFLAGDIVNSYRYGAGDVWLFHDPGGFSCLSSWGNIPHSVENTRVSRILFNWFQVIGISNASPEKKVWWAEFWKFMASPQFSSLFTEWVNRSSPNESIEITYLVVT